MPGGVDEGIHDIGAGDLARGVPAEGRAVELGRARTAGAGCG